MESEAVNCRRSDSTMASTEIDNLQNITTNTTDRATQTLLKARVNSNAP